MLPAAAESATASASPQAEPTVEATAEPEPTPEAEASQHSDTIQSDLVPGVDLEVEEVRPGVYRVLNDGIATASAPKAATRPPKIKAIGKKKGPSHCGSRAAPKSLSSANRPTVKTEAP